MLGRPEPTTRRGPATMPRDETCLRRQWALLRALSAARTGLTLREMAAELGVTERTIRRDLDVFRDVGFPLEEQVGDFGRKAWRVRPGVGPPLAFTFDEAVALHLGRRLLEPLAGTFFGDASLNAFRKIRAALGTEALRYVDRFAGTFYQAGVGLGDYRAKAELIDALVVAAEDSREARIVYRSEGEAGASPREVRPFGVVYHRGALYLVAEDAAQGRIKHYKIDRVEEAEALGRRFERPEGFDLAEHMAAAFGVYRNGEPTAVKVRFGPAAARYVREARWHESQALTDLPDGGVLAEFTVSGTEAIKHWVLGFGAKAVVVEPDALRREIQQELEETLSAYRGPECSSATRRAASPVGDRHQR